MTRRLAMLVVLNLGLVALATTSAFAEQGLPDGFDDPGLGDPGGFADTGMPTGFAVFFVLAVVAGVATTLWKVSMSRQMARESGMDPDRAAAMTLMSDDGLDATYLASSLRGPEPAAGPPVTRTAGERLRELDQLRAEGLVTEAEYDSRRKAIIDSV